MKKPIDNKTKDLKVELLKDWLAKDRGFCEITWCHPQLFGKNSTRSKFTVPFKGHKNMTDTLLRSKIQLPDDYYSSLRSLREYLYGNDYSDEHVDTIVRAIIEKTQTIHLTTNVRKVTVPDYFPSHFHESFVKESFYIPNVREAYRYVSRNIVSIIR